MPPAGSRHGSAVAWCGRGVLVLGAAGSGKSALVAGLLLAGGYLVADDLVRLKHRAGRLLASGVAPRGLIELRGSGIFRTATTGEVPVNLCVEFVVSGAGERLPERTTSIVEGVDLPLLRVHPGGTAPVAGVLMALLGRREH